MSKISGETRGSGARWGQRRILLAEDSSTQAAYLRHVFEQNGYAVTVAENGNAALAAIEKERPDIVISDILMPEMDGFELCRRMKTAPGLKDIPLILVTNLSHPRDVLQALECGADNFIIKSSDQQFLLSQIEGFLSSRVSRAHDEEFCPPIEIRCDDEQYQVCGSQQKLIKFFLSAYQAAIQKHAEAEQASEELRVLNDTLEVLVEERTAAYRDEIAMRRQIEQALRESEEMFRNPVERSLVGIHLVQDGVIRYANARFSEMFGYTHDELRAGKEFWDLVAPEDRAGVEETIGRMAASAQPYAHYEFRGVRKDRRIIAIEAYGCPTVYHGKPAVVQNLMDVTERKQAEEGLRRRTDDLVRQSRDLESAHREANLYLDILTHDIGNTENVSNLYADLLIDSLEGEAADYAKRLQQSVQKSIEILKTVSTIRQIHRASSELRPVDLDAVAREVIENFPGSTLRYEGGHSQVLANDLLSVIFNNLIGNAVKHGGLDVEITVRVEDMDEFIRVTVEDTGPGVPDDEKDAIFHRYEQQKRGVGEGLGLYLVQILVERYGGHIRVDDRVPGHPEKGAAFRFTLRKA